MLISESNLRRLIRQEIELSEGIFDGNAGAGRPTPVPPDILAAAKAKEKEITTKRASLASKKVDASIPKDVKDSVKDMKPEDIKKFVKEFPPEATKDKKATATATAAVLKMSKTNGAQAKELTDAIKQNPNLRTAINNTPGMADLGNVVDTNLRSVGKDPNRQAGEAWRELGQVASRNGLAE